MPNVFFVDGDGHIVPMKSAGFENELDFQELLTTCPDLLPGDLITPNDPRRWLLITPELGIPIDDGGADNFSLDHLLLDQDGVPTFIEVKRATDTRLRREVVAQMLDYAANANTYSSVEAMQAQMAKHYKTDDAGVNAKVAEFLGDPDAVDSFWQAVKTNLSAARMRLVFVADAIPSGLLRVIEFLNAHTDPLEVLAVEIRQYQHEDGRRMLVPQLLGQTAESVERKAVTRQKRQWDEASFIDEVRARHGEPVLAAVRRIVEWAKADQQTRRGVRLTYGTGPADGSMYVVVDAKGTWFSPLAIWTFYGRAETQFQYLSPKPVFDDPKKRLELAEMFNGLQGVSIPTDDDTLKRRRPWFALEQVAASGDVDRLLAILDWFVAQVADVPAR